MIAMTMRTARTSRPAATPAVLRPARPRDLDAVLRLHHAGVNDVPPGVFRSDGRAFFENAVERELCVVADVGGEVMGYGALTLPDPGRSYLADAAGMNGEAAAHIESAAVHRTLRGAGLHRRLIAWRVEKAKAEGCDAVLCSASPLNAASLRNLIAAGFHVRALTALYGGFSRYVLVYGAPAVLHENVSVMADADDEAKCGALLADGWRAISGARRSDRLELTFVK